MGAAGWRAALPSGLRLISLSPFPRPLPPGLRWAGRPRAASGDVLRSGKGLKT